MKKFLLLCIIWSGVAWLKAAPTHDTPPNVLVIIADDMGYNGISYHNPKVTTPNLAKLAKEGIQLERFYAYPVCSPARAAFLSGMMPRRYGVVDVVGPNQLGLPQGTPTLASTLKAAGYQTSLIGKWHLGNIAPSHYGFDHFYGFMGAELDYFTHLDPHGRPDWWRENKPLEEAGYTTYLLTDEAVKQIKARDKTKPFYYQVAYNAPHTTLAAPNELLEKHKSDGVYGAVLEGLDTGIGKILATLDEQGLRENTLVVFFSDNGAPRRVSPNTPLNSGKDTVFEGGIRTPAIVRWPNHTPPGLISQHPIAVNDLFPTIFAALNLPLPQNLKLDGSNQWQALLSPQPTSRAPFLIASHDIACFDGDWKLIETTDGKRTLYNLKTDLSETKDEAAAHPDIFKNLGSKLDELKQGLPADAGRRMGPGGPGGPGKGRGPGKGPGGPGGPGNGEGGK